MKMQENRRISKPIFVGNLQIGGGAPVILQSMCSVPVTEKKKIIGQIKALYDLGCQLIRVAVPDVESALILPEIIQASPMPVVADIHFDHKLALMAIDQGVAKLRLNPGNISHEKKLALVAEKAKKANIPIRVGANSGSLPPALLKKYNGPTPQALAQAALEQAKILEELGFENMIISAKASSVLSTIKVNEILAEQCDYPIHAGVTEAGTPMTGTARSCAALSPLLLKGLIDTIRISLSGNPLDEIRAGRELLSSLGIRDFGPIIIACPTCGRTRINVSQLAKKVERRTEKMKKPLKIAVMGCVVNGPGEAKEADIAICGGIGVGSLYKKGEKIITLPYDELLDRLMEEIESF